MNNDHDTTIRYAIEYLILRARATDSSAYFTFLYRAHLYLPTYPQYAIVNHTI